MNSRDYDVYKSFAHERNSRILKASNDARRLRSLTKKTKDEPKKQSRRVSRPRLLNGLASLLKVRKQQPA